MPYASHINCGWFHIHQDSPEATPAYVSTFVTIEINKVAPEWVRSEVEAYFEREQNLFIKAHTP